MEKKSGNAINVLKNMPFNLIGKLTLRFVVLGSTNVIVELYFPGIENDLKIRFLLGKIGYFRGIDCQFYSFLFQEG